MSDLPSRDTAQRIEASRPEDEPNLGVWIEVKVAAKQAVWAEYLSGRLVDREAIDYEAAYSRFDAVVAQLSTSDLVTVDKIMGNINSIIDAALGEET